MQRIGKAWRHDGRTLLRILEIFLVLGVLPVLVHGALGLDGVAVV
jgi:hypothetical protein